MTPVDAIIVLGRGINEDGSLPEDPRSRVRKAAALYTAGVAPLLIVSGAWTYHAAIRPVRSEAQAMKAYAIELGVPESTIIEESKSMDTIGNVYFTKKDIIEPKNLRNITVIASEDHMPRVQYLFEKIYGNDYNFEFVESDRVISDAEYEKEKAHEESSMTITRKWLYPVRVGDDATVWELMRTIHPAYAPQGNVQSKKGDGVYLYEDAP